MDRREWVKWLTADVRIVVTTMGRPPERYAIRLETWTSRAWQTVHLFDNAHGQHDSHRYRGAEKLAAESVPAVTVSQAITMALRLLSDDWERIIQRWRDE